MRAVKSGFIYASLSVLVTVAMICTVRFPTDAHPQNTETISAGTTVHVRTNEPIHVKDDDGRVYSGFVEQDVMNSKGGLAIQKASPVELIVRRISGDELRLDLESITVNGERYAAQTEEHSAGSKENDIVGAIIGAIAGAGQAAGVAASAGAAGGAGAPLTTHGKTVNVPAESLLTFRLSQPLRAGIADNGFTTNGIHYHR